MIIGMDGGKCADIAVYRLAANGCRRNKTTSAVNYDRSFRMVNSWVWK
jgi:hypothetical protein